MEEILDSYSESNYSGNASIICSIYDLKYGQTFKPSKKAKLTSCKFYIDKSGSPTGNCWAELYQVTAVSGVYRSNGTLLATSDMVDVTTLSVRPTKSLITFTFSGDQQYKMSSNVMYAIVFCYEGGDASNNTSVGEDITSPTHHGNRTNYRTSWSSSSSQDTPFYVYGIEETNSDFFTFM